MNYVDAAPKFDEVVEASAGEESADLFWLMFVGSLRFH